MMTSDHYENLEKTYRAATGVLNDMVERDIAVLKNLKDITDQCAGGNLPRVRAQLLLKLTVALQRDHSSRWTDKLRGPTPESNAEFIKRLKNHSLDLDTLSCMNYYNPIYRAVPSQLHAAMHYARDTIAMERIKGIVDNGLDTVVEIDMRAARDRPTGGRVYSAKVILECPWATPELTGLRRLLYHVYQYLREDMTYEGLHNRVNADVVRIKMSNLVRHRLHLEIDVWVAPEAECYLRKIWDHSTYDKVTLAQEHISTFTAVSIKIDGVYRCSMPCEIDSDGTVVMYGTLAQGQCPVCNEIRDTKMLIHRSVHSEHDECIDCRPHLEFDPSLPCFKPTTGRLSAPMWYCLGDLTMLDFTTESLYEWFVSAMKLTHEQASKFDFNYLTSSDVLLSGYHTAAEFPHLHTRKLMLEFDAATRNVDKDVIEIVRKHAWARFDAELYHFPYYPAYRAQIRLRAACGTAAKYLHLYSTDLDKVEVVHDFTNKTAQLKIPEKVTGVVRTYTVSGCVPKFYELVNQMKLKYPRPYECDDGDLEKLLWTIEQWKLCGTTEASIADNSANANDNNKRGATDPDAGKKKKKRKTRRN